MSEMAYVAQHRKRSKVACETCRELKRKCDGASPCGTCVRFEYHCSYAESSARRKRKHMSRGDHPVLAAPIPAPDSVSGPQATPRNSAASAPSTTSASCSPHNNLLTVEANSGAAFVRKLALGIDPKNAPRMHLFAWNAFLGAREATGTPVSRLITDILSEADMVALSKVYFADVDPCYSFIKRQEFEQHMNARWRLPDSEHPYDAVLCGVAALGCLFSHVHPPAAELDLIQSAKIILEREMNQAPSLATIAAWVLRTAYLRMTGTSHSAWMASCITMHLVEAAGLHCEPIKDSVLHTLDEDVDPEIRRGLVGVARHLNVWMSFDTGCSRVMIHNMSTIFPSTRPGSFTHEVLGLLPYCDILDPEKVTDAQELEVTLSSVLDRLHTEPPSVLAQTNIMLCICRRLKSLNMVLHGKILEQVLALARKGVRAAQSMVETGSPWHHMANIPFQVICILLVIDTSASISQIKETMRCLQAIVAKYNTEATVEALRTASLLILLHQKRKQKCASELHEILKIYPISGGSDAREPSGDSQPQPEESGWLDSLAIDLPGLEGFGGLEQLLNEGFAWDFGNNAP
ncbi:unnamed protein product [Clonostachys rhizophaga]|uniref:Zn(2)-C6 fungal-type domain-containing protein n=1 Tax=Clonostachys rhizophaga TaxID=160324 RepID=A0A9N9VKC8_9HYPO|nr:unnamed protein product [Clonostachys rhizophaga]